MKGELGLAGAGRGSLEYTWRRQVEDKMKGPIDQEGGILEELNRVTSGGPSSPVMADSIGGRGKFRSCSHELLGKPRRNR